MSNVSVVIALLFIYKIKYNENEKENKKKQQLKISCARCKQNLKLETSNKKKNKRTELKQNLELVFVNSGAEGYCLSLVRRTFSLIFYIFLVFKKIYYLFEAFRNSAVFGNSNLNSAAETEQPKWVGISGMVFSWC